MQRFVYIIFVLMLGLGVWGAIRPLDPLAVPNPDPNHVHADFGVWIDGEKLDFSDEKYMSGSSTDLAHEGALHTHLHLHDGNGNVIHSHKPGQTIGDFFQSIGFSMTIDGCFTLDTGEKICQMRLLIDGIAAGFDPEHPIEDLRTYHLTNAATQAEHMQQGEHMTDDACLYSQRCPWRGSPPVENCVADPAVPCVE